MTHAALPPYAAFLGIRRDADGLALPFADALVGRPGFIHGGAIGGLLEIAAIAALNDALAGAGRIKPINVTVDYVRGGRALDTFARGMVTRLGTRIANVAAEAWQDDPARPIARAHSTYLIVRDRPAAAGAGGGN